MIACRLISKHYGHKPHFTQEFYIGNSEMVSELAPDELWNEATSKDVEVRVKIDPAGMSRIMAAGRLARK